MRIVFERILAQEDVIVPQHHVAAFHVNRLGKIVYLLVVDLAVNLFVGVYLVLTVGNHVGYHYLVVDYETYVARKDLVAARNELRTQHLHSVFEEYLLEGVHFGRDGLLGGIYPVFYRLVRLAVVGFLQSWSGAVRFGFSENHGAKPRSLVTNKNVHWLSVVLNAGTKICFVFLQQFCVFKHHCFV